MLTSNTKSRASKRGFSILLITSRRFNLHPYGFLLYQTGWRFNLHPYGIILHMARRLEFYLDEYYHVFNRGVDARKVFLSKSDIIYFLDSIIISNQLSRVLSNGKEKQRKIERNRARNNEPIVKVVAYAILPNHFHLILKEIKEGGISKFMQRLGTSYTMYFNEKYSRSGALFQGRFKATHIADLTAVSSYVNLNFKHHNIDLDKQPIKTSWFEYVDPESVHEPVCDKIEVSSIIKYSGGVNKYKKDARHWSGIFVETHQQDKNFEL